MASQVPVWAVENRTRFLRAAKAAGDSAGKPPPISASSVYRSMYGSEALARANVKVEKVDGSSMLTTAPRIAPPPPDVRPELEWYRDENNHPDILSTILETARANANYSPATSAPDNAEAASMQHAAFLKFLEEVDEYHAFLTLQQMDTKRVANSSMDCEGLVSAVADVISAALGEAGQSIKDRIANTIRTAAERVTKNVNTNSVVEVGYNNVNLPAPATDRPNRDPTTALCFSIVGMSRTVQNNGALKGTTDSKSEFLYITAATYRMRSSSVSAYAFYLAGSTIVPAEEVIKNFQSVG